MYVLSRKMRYYCLNQRFSTPLNHSLSNVDSGGIGGAQYGLQKFSALRR